MSFFQDDFYSTKVSRWKRRGYDSSRDRNRMFWVAAISVAAGMVLCFLLLLFFGGIGGGSEGNRGAKGVASKGGEDSVIRAAAKVRPTIVSVVSTFQDGKTGKPTGTGMGSGIIFENSGGKALVVTNNHVVEGASSYEIVMTGGQRKKAEVVGMDRITDLAVLQMDGGGVRNVAEFGDSDQLQSGETAISIGNPLGLNFAQTVTVGVISSPKVTIPVELGSSGETEWEMDLIQTDAAINRGNSGGALVSLDGKVVGINSLKVADMGVEGLGFAIPINAAKPIIEALVNDGKVARPFMGVTTQALTSFQNGKEVLHLPSEVKGGAVVLETTGPAKEAGLATNDVITELDGRSIDGPLALRKYLYSEKKIGETLKVTYYRSGKKEGTKLVLSELK